MQPFDALDTEWSDALFEAAPVAMAVVAPDHRFARCNDAFCQLTGYSRAELIGRTWQSITHPDDLAGDQSGANVAKQDRNHPTYTVAKRYLSKRGGIVWVNLHVRSVWTGGVFNCYLVHALQQPPARCDDCPTYGRKPAARKGVVEWAKENPKDAAIVVLAGAAFLGRDEAIALLKTLVK